MTTHVTVQKKKKAMRMKVQIEVRENTIFPQTDRQKI